MSHLTSVSSQQLAVRVAQSALGILFLTSVHHAYGAYIYDTPRRLQVVFVSVLAGAAIVGSLLEFRTWATNIVGEIAFWIFAAVTFVIPLAGIGVFEGGYNHAVKDALYLAGASPTLMHRLFPSPMYELPNNLFFEITGVLQFVFGIVTGYLLYRLIEGRQWKPEVRVGRATAV